MFVIIEWCQEDTKDENEQLKRNIEDMKMKITELAKREVESC